MPNTTVSRSTVIRCACAELNSLATEPRWTAEIIERACKRWWDAPYEDRGAWLERELFGAPAAPGLANWDMLVAVSLFDVLIDSGALE